ncbi:MAG: hypothetical protein JJU29_21825 [Verrucomicrobia bacterium]|nr:hypothetical protein [Verrucomicrobiota bacterium]MCH8514419.1 hypothetical protein [Kiritimatiellia bacterium]
MKFETLSDAFDFVNFDGGSMDNRALVNRDDGRVHYDSDIWDSCEEEPEDLETGNWIEVPNKIELDLGNRVVEDFVQEKCPHLDDKVRRIGGRGFYGRYKVLLQENDLLESWYAFEQAREDAALRQWAKDEGIPIDPPDPASELPE